MRSFASFQVILLSLGLFLADCNTLPQNETVALTSFKRGIIEDPRQVLSGWNSVDSHPCEWSGISCSFARDHVIKLNLSGASLKGFIAPELYQLSSLRELNLHGNFLINKIPKEIGMLKNLKVLDLGVNQLTGTIPPEIGNLTNLVKINLQSNGLTGRLPAELGYLKHLEEIRLDRNRLQGRFPASNGSEFSSKMHGTSASSGKPSGLCLSSHIKFADFSYNFFNGSIPKCLGYLPRTSFQRNCLQDKDSKQRSTEQCGGAPPSKSHLIANTQHQPVEDRSKHEPNSSKPAWILALEIVTAVVVGSRHCS